MRSQERVFKERESINLHAIRIPTSNRAAKGERL